MVAIVTDEIKRQIRARLALKDMTQQQLAEQLGMHETTLSRMMAGDNVGTIERWKEVLRAVGLRLKVEVIDAEGSSHE